MVALMREGNFGKALVGYAIGIQLPIVAYRTGQHVALYIFVWRCRRETKRDERRGGYGLRLDDHSSCGSSQDDNDMMMGHSDTLANHNSSDLPIFTFDEESGGSQEGGTVLRSSPSPSVSNTTATPRSRIGASPTKRNKTTANNKKRDRIVQEEATTRDTPSVRAIATALFVLSFVMQITSLVLYNTPSEQQFAISLLFSPLGVIGRWKLSQKWNSRIPGFPLGTFTCNLLSCALSGSLGTLLAGNPGPEESLVVTAMINGFAGTLSTLATFIIEILANIDPLLFNFDGFIYAMVTIFWGIVIGLVTQASQNWADHI
jgi:fluoride ion exporter CrcB/FEX